MLSDITHNISKRISKNIKFNLICQYKTTPTLSLLIHVKRNRLFLFAESQHPLCKTIGKTTSSTDVYNKLTYPALEGKPGN